MRLTTRHIGLGIALALATAVPCPAAAAEGAPHILLGGTEPLGLRGLLRVVAAERQPRGTFALGTSYAFYRASDFLAVDGMKADHSRVAATYAVAWTPWPLLEAALAMHVISDETTGATGDELQVAVGDPELALKSGLALGHGLQLGGLLDLRLSSAVGFFKLSGSALNVLVAALASWQAPHELPLRAHLNVGFQLDGSTGLFDDPTRLSPAQRQSVQLSSFDRVVARVGVEYLTRWVGPFVELNLEPFVGAGAPAFGESPGQLTLGLRGWLGARRGLQLLAALDIGLTGVGDGSPSTLDAGKFAFSTPPWALTLGVAYRFDPQPAVARPALAAAAPAVPAPAADTPPAPAERAALSGTVVAGDNDEPLWDARVAIDGEAASALAVDPKTGAFRSYPLPLGAARLAVSASGFETLRTAVTVAADGPPLRLRLQRKVTASTGTLRGIVSERGGAAIATATVLLPELDRTLGVDARGNFSLELKPGEYNVVISAPRYRPQRKRLRVFEGSTVILNVELYR